MPQGASHLCHDALLQHAINEEGCDDADHANGEVQSAARLVSHEHRRIPAPPGAGEAEARSDRRGCRHFLLSLQRNEFVGAQTTKTAAVSVYLSDEVGRLRSCQWSGVNGGPCHLVGLPITPALDGAVKKPYTVLAMLARGLAAGYVSRRCGSSRFCEVLTRNTKKP